MTLDPALRERISATISGSRVVLFMKGDRFQPRCGFSAAVVEVLDEVGVPYETVDVLADPEVREGIKVYSNWPTIPQLYVEGRFVGGCDIVRQLHATGELHRMLGVEPEEVPSPELHVTEAAAAELRRALQGAEPGDRIRLVVNARFQAGLDFDRPQPGDFEIEAAGVPFLVDRGSAKRANGVRIDFQQSTMGRGFVVENPNRPAGVRPIAPRELKARLEAGEPLRLYDVRGPDERAVARIEGARPLDEEAAREIESLPRDTVLVFHCHHGVRSREAAEHFAARGFRNVFNLTGGIDAWSREVDPSVPRY